MSFVELCCRSCYSFLEGASGLEALVARAKMLQMPALALTDRNALYGASTFYKLCREAGIKPILGAEISVAGEEIVLLCRNMEGYRSLSRLITEGQRDRPKGVCEVSLRQLANHATGMICLLPEQERVAPYLEIFGHEATFVALRNHREEGDAEVCRRRQQLGVRCVATNAPRYATPGEGPLYDVLCCIRHRRTLSDSHHIRPANHNRYLKGADDMAKLFERELLDVSCEIAEQCSVDLDFSCYRFPKIEGASHRLRELCIERLPGRYPQPSVHVCARLEEELGLIERLDLSGYFLIVWDIVEFAKSRDILAQGRGSAANSLVAYVLGITPVDPIAHKLFLGRFIHEKMTTIPDIDLDFAAARGSGLPDREEIIQYVYERFGSDHVAMVCTFITFQGRLAIREVARVLELPQELIDRMAKLAGHSVSGSLKELSSLEEFAAFLESHKGKLFVDLVSRIANLPRHLSIHVGGMLIASRPISDLVPLEPARMEGRVVCQWDKDMVDDAGLIKVDILGLGMLAVLRDTANLIPSALDLEALPQDDQSVYEMIGKADTVGVFQVESRAQMQSLPRTRPRNLPELGIQVAIIRPGPIQGKMVNPYILRRQGREAVAFPHPCLEPVLGDTLGVILFQEQVLQTAVVMAGFSAGQAAHLRRAMSRKRSNEAMQRLKEAFVSGAIQKGIPVEVAEQTFSKLEGFALYGFCKSHALSFAHITYQSAYLKRYHPAAFLAALLNNQPMGFYSSEVLIEDAKRHGVRVLPVEINASRALAVLEGGAVRLGLKMVSGVSLVAARQIEQHQPFATQDDFIRRCALDERTTEKLISAGAFDALVGARRGGYWRLWGGRCDDFVAEQLVIPPLPQMSEWEQMMQDYKAVGYSPKGHPLAFLRRSLEAQGCQHARAFEEAEEGSRLTVVALQVIRQRPPTARGFAFLTLEDEFGLINVVVPPDLYERQKVLIKTAGLLGLVGSKEERDSVLNLKALALFPVKILH